MRGSRAARPGFRRAAAALAAVAGGAGLLVGCGSSKYPAFLPEKTLHVHDDTILTGTAARPALTSQGLPVEVVTPRWRVRAVVTGPLVPGEGLPVVQPATYCTWTVTLSAATADVPLSIADFRPVDFVGETYRLSLVPGEAAPPSVLHPKQTITFQVRAFEAAGEGLMQWAPDGHHVLAKWDFVVEND